MPLGTDDVQSTKLYNPLMILFALWHCADEVHLLGMFALNRIEVALSITTQQDVDTTTSHVRGNGNCTTTACLGHDLRLTFMMLGIQHIVWYATFIEQTGEI